MRLSPIALPARPQHDLEGHAAANCPNSEVPLCYNCKSPDHKSNECTLPAQTASKTCYNCGQTGHVANDCTNEKVVMCYNCNTEGHIAKEVSPRPSVHDCWSTRIASTRLRLPSLAPCAAVPERANLDMLHVRTGWSPSSRLPQRTAGFQQQQWLPRGCCRCRCFHH